VRRLLRLPFAGSLEPVAFACSPSMARISRVSASRPRWTLHHGLGREAPCLRQDHSPSPMALMPVLSTRRCRAPLVGRQRMGTVRSCWRQQSVLASGPGQSSLASFNRLTTSPVVCRSGSPNSARHAQDTSGLQHPKRWPDNRAGHSGPPATPSSDQTRSATCPAASEPRRSCARWSCGGPELRACSSSATHPLRLHEASLRICSTKPRRPRSKIGGRREARPPVVFEGNMAASEGCISQG